MNLFEFLDLKYQNAAMELQLKYSVTKDGKAKAVHSLINLYRSMAKWVWKPILLTQFVLMRFKLLPMPTPPVLPERPKAPQINKVSDTVVTGEPEKTGSSSADSRMG